MAALHFEERMKTAGPAFSLPVSKEEKKIAEELRKEFLTLLKELEKFSRYLLVFFDRIDDLADTENLHSLGPLMKKYERKLKKKFNDFLQALEEGLAHYNDSFADTELDNIRDLIIEHAKSMRKSLLTLLDLFDRVGDPEFIQSAKTAYEGIAKSIEQLEFVIREELFDHIDYDILGRIRLGSSQLPLTVELTRG
jgi:hypothetical protein